MAEKSYFWDAAGGGDASIMPYDEDEVADWFRWIFMHDASYQGVISGEGNGLEVTNPSDTDIQIDTGAAMVYGTFYWNDEPISIPALLWNPAATYYYRIVLMKTWSTQHVKFDWLGPAAGGYPALTQTFGVRWMINLADVSISTTGVVSVIDQRHFVHTKEHQTLKSPVRIGDPADKNWNVPSTEYQGEEIWVQHTARLQQGTIRWTGVAAPSGSIAVTFPMAFSYAPICVVEHYGTTAKIMTSVQTTTTTVTIYWEDENGDNQTSLDFQWLAAGPIIGGA